MEPREIFAMDFGKPFRSCPLRVTVTCLMLCVPLVLAVAPAFAQGSTPTSENGPSDLDTAHEQASTMVLDFANWVDDFFDDERFANEENRSRIKLELSTGYSRNDDFELKPRVSGRIDLPHFNNKLNLLISASDEEDFLIDQNPISAVPRHQESGNREVAVALQYFHRDEEKYNFSTSLGGSFQYLSAGARFRYSQDFGSWYGRFINRLQYYTDDGLENLVSYDIDYLISDHWLSRTTLAADWLEERDGLQHSLLFRFFQMINPEKAIVYEVGNYFDTEDSYSMTDLQFRLQYRQRFLRDWLILEVAPQVTFPKEHDREANPGVVIKLEALFGNLSGLNILSRVFDF